MLREARAVTSSPEGLDQLDSRDHSPAQYIYRCSLVRESCTLCDGDFQVASNSTLVSLNGEFERLLGGKNCFILSLGFFLQDAQGGKIVFYLLEAGQHGFAIGSHSLVVDRNGLI